MRIIVSEAEEYAFHFDSLMASEGIALKKRAGFVNRIAFRDGLNEDDPEAWQALVWLLRCRQARADGAELPRYSDVEFPWGSCRIEFDDDELARIEAGMAAIAEAEAEGQPPPDPPAGEPDADPTEESPAT